MSRAKKNGTPNYLNTMYKKRMIAELAFCGITPKRPHEMKITELEQLCKDNEIELNGYSIPQCYIGAV